MHQHKPSDPREDLTPTDQPPARPRRARARLSAKDLFSSGRSTLLGRLKHRVRRRTRTTPPATTKTLLPLLIKVFAGFSKVDGQLLERDIDSSLGFLRYDYPETVYSELRQLYRDALDEHQNLNEMAQQLSKELSLEDKILLGVQLYVLISRADLQKDQLITFYLFMTNLGIASQAIDIVYQLNTSELDAAEVPRTETVSQPLDSLIIARDKPADVIFNTPSGGYRLAAFRFQNLILLKNIGTETIIARGRQLRDGEFCRIYDGQRVLLSEVVLDYQDLIFYFNAKKNVSSAQLYLSFGLGENPFIERSQSKQSVLEIKFGLNISVLALHDTRATINGIRLQKGTTLEVSLQDKIVFRNKTEIAFSELRRRARELGGKFDLLPTKSEYLVSNNPNLLRKGDILLSPGASGEILLRIRCDYTRKSGELEVLASDRPIFVQKYPVRYRASLKDGDTISIGDSQFLLCDFGERIIEEQRNIIRRLEISDLTHTYGVPNETALDSISLSVQRGEMICVMGPSGCGKSTLLRTLAAQLRPNGGQVLLNEISLYDHLPNFTPYISFIPHEDAFDPLLTVQENIDFASALRAPHFAPAERKRRADAKLVELGLNERRHRLSGDEGSKNLSGGERKRLNIGMDMMGIADVYLFDEPTSGLSSKDSEHLMEIIRGLAHNKIIFVSIHQPSAKLFHMFDKALLLDHGGKMAFFGSPNEMLDYFEKARAEGLVRAVSSEQEPIEQDINHRQPEFIFDVLETPLRDLGGDIIYEEDTHGHLVPARRFSPDFWRDRFAADRLIEEVRTDIGMEPADHTSSSKGPPQAPHRSLKDEFTHLSTLVKRSFLSKLRNRANLVTTLLEAPMLAVLVAMVLRYSEDGGYNYASAFHIPTYLFLSLVIGMFLGLTNSADEIIRERILLQRERNQGIRASYYIFSKLVTLGFFALAQCVIYVLIGNAILAIRDMFFVNLFWIFVTTMIGVVVGLFISTLVSSAKTALNIIPLILIPNIILGGALIKYEEMNRDFDIIYYAKRWFKPVDEEGEDRLSDLKVPYICQFMPLRWSYEAIIISHAQLNPISSFQEYLKGRIKTLASSPILPPEDEDKLQQAKEALAVTFGLQGDNAGDIRKQIRRIKTALENGSFDPRVFYPEGERRQTAEELYLNEKVLDLVNIAEAERLDYRHAEAHPDVPPDEVFPNVFFGTEKKYLKLRVNTLYANAAMMALFALAGLILVHFCLRRQLTKV